MSIDRTTRVLESDIDRTAQQLLSRHPVFLAHERFMRDRLAELAHRAYQTGQSDAYLSLQTSDDVADAFGVARRTIHYHANHHDIGWKLGRDRLFRPTDIEALRAYVGQPPGRKRRTET